MIPLQPSAARRYWARDPFTLAHPLLKDVPQTSFGLVESRKLDSPFEASGLQDGRVTARATKLG